MLIQVISDIHGSVEDLRTAIDSFAVRKPDILLVSGDFLNHGPRNDLPAGYDTKATAALLNQYKDKIICVRGNCDSEVDQMMLDFPCLNAYTNLFIPTAAGEKANGRIFVHHGHLYDRPQLQTWLPSGSLVPHMAPYAGPHRAFGRIRGHLGRIENASLLSVMSIL